MKKVYVMRIRTTRQLCVLAVASETGDPISGFELSEFRLLLDLLRTGVVPSLLRSLRTCSSNLFWSAILRTASEMEKPKQKENFFKPKQKEHMVIFSNTAC